MREQKQVAILESFKEFRETDFIGMIHHPKMVTEARLLSYDGEVAEVETIDGRQTVQLNMSADKLADFKELARHNDTVFLKDGSVIDWSCLSIWNGTLAPVEVGGDVYE